MKITKLKQHTPEWLLFRASHKCSSEAPAMMGASQKVQRNELLRMKATGSEKEYSQWVLEVLFARGHEVEALVRPFAEEFIGDDLFPVIGESDERPDMAASFDGATMAVDIIWECKQYNERKAALVREGQVPEDDLWQCVHQLFVSRAKKLLYTVSDGTRENTVHCWLLPDAKRSKALLDGWKQLEADVLAYTPEPQKQEVVAAPIEALPAVSVSVSGSLVVSSNLDIFDAKLRAFVAAIPAQPSTDQDFADCDAAVKALKRAEEMIDAAIESIIAGATSVEENVRRLRNLREVESAARIATDKLVTTRKQQIKTDAVLNATKALADHCNTINKRWAGRGIFVSPPHADFAGAIRGLKSFDSLRNAIDTALARAKIEANASGERIDENLRQLAALAPDNASLFPDLFAIALKDTPDFVATVKSRLSDHQAEQARIADEKSRASLLAAVGKEPKAAVQASAGPVARSGRKPVPIRPTDGELVAVLSAHFQQTPAQVIGWLQEIDFDRLASMAAQPQPQEAAA